MIEIEQGRLDDAIADCDEALRLKPKFGPAYENRGLARLRKGDYQQAIADSTQGIELNRLSPEGLVNRGVAYRALGEEDKALADWTAAIRVSPHHEPAYVNRADLRCARGEWEGAIADYTLLLKPRLEQLQAGGTHPAGSARGVTPAGAQTARLLVERGAAYVGRSAPADLATAVSDSTLAMVLNPADPEAFEVRSRAYRALGEAAKADADSAHARRLSTRPN